MSLVTLPAKDRLTLGGVLAGAFLWACAMAASAWAGLTWREWENSASITRVAALFFAGGLFAFPLALLPAGWLSSRWARQRRFALAVVALGFITIAATALLYALHYRLYYSEWHDHAFTFRWVLQVGFTTLAACYQFAVMGMRLFVPVGFCALLAAALWFARQGD